MSFARRLRRNAPPPGPPPLALLPPVPPGYPPESWRHGLCERLEANSLVAGWARKAAKEARCPTMELVLPLVHVEQPLWLTHFGIEPGSGQALVARGGYLSGAFFRKEAVMEAHESIEAELEAAWNGAWRDQPQNALLVLFLDADGATGEFVRLLPRGESIEEETEYTGSAGAEEA